MKKRGSLICVLIMLLVLTSVASASPPQPASFTITGYTTSYEYRTLPSSRTKFRLTAQGIVTEFFDGTFHYDESGTVYLDLETGTGSGNNRATMTITSGTGTAIIRFRGQTTIEGMTLIPDPPYMVPEGTVEGTFTVLAGTGTYAGLHGQGTYTGILPPPYQPFEVDFTGQFHIDP